MWMNRSENLMEGKGIKSERLDVDPKLERWPITNLLNTQLELRKEGEGCWGQAQHINIHLPLPGGSVGGLKCNVHE